MDLIIETTIFFFFFFFWLVFYQLGFWYRKGDLGLLGISVRIILVISFVFHKNIPQRNSIVLRTVSNNARTPIFFLLFFFAEIYLALGGFAPQPHFSKPSEHSPQEVVSLHYELCHRALRDSWS